MCQDGQKALFCSYSALLKTKKMKKLQKLVESGIALIKAYSTETTSNFTWDSISSTNDEVVDATNLVFTKEEVKLDLFAITCDNPGGSSLCSEFVRSILYILRAMRRKAKMNY